jgi:hypothetical protein
VRMIPTRGCPQGGIASSRFWIMVADSLMKRLKESGYYAIGYGNVSQTFLTHGTKNYKDFVTAQYLQKFNFCWNNTRFFDF